MLFIERMVAYCFFFVREDKGDQILDYKQEIQTMEDQFKKLQKEVHTLQMTITVDDLNS